MRTGVDIRTNAALLGHKTLQMTMRYSHLSPGHLQDAVNLLDKVCFKSGTNMAQSGVDLNDNFSNIL